MTHAKLCAILATYLVSCLYALHVTSTNVIFLLGQNLGITP